MDNNLNIGSERFQSRLSGGVILDNIRKLREDFKNLYKTEIKKKEISECSGLFNEDIENNISEKECEALNINTINFPLHFSSKKLNLTKENFFDKYGKTVNSCENLGKLMFCSEGNPLDSLTTNTFSGRNTEKKELLNSNFNKESSKRNGTSVFESYNLNFLNIEPSLKPRKGDKTPLSNFLEVSDLDRNKDEEESRDSNLNYKQEENQIEDLLMKAELKKFDLNSKEIFPYFNKSDLIISGKASKLEKKKRNVSVDPPICITQLDNEKDGKKTKNELFVSNLQINGNSHFIERMLFDIFKRQTKEERLKKIIDQKKNKKNESEITSTFNRLIKDANRRLEASNRIEKIKDKINIDLTKTKKKTFKENDWDSYYTQSVKKFSENRDNKIKEKQIQKEKTEKEKEEKILQTQKVRKVSNKEIDLIFKKIYERKNVSKYVGEEHKRKFTSESEKMMEFTLSPSSVVNKFCSQKAFHPNKDQKNLFSPSISKIEEKIKNVSNNISNTKKCNYKSKTVYGSLQLIKKNSENKEKKLIPISNRNKNSVKQLPFEESRHETLTDSNIPQAYLINIKDCKGIKKEKKTLKTPKHINDMQASKLVNNIFQKIKIDFK